MSDLAIRSAVTVAVANLTVIESRHAVPIVERVSFDVPAGEIIGLVGESGCGKSTVALALLGHVRSGLRLAGGSVRIGDVDVLRLRPPDLRQARGRLVSYVPQDPASSLNPGLRVGDQLRESLSVHRGVLGDGQTVDDRTMEVLAEVNLPASERLLRSYPHQLSGGQLQRIGIGMAFACRPRLIVMDEPTTGLDVTTQSHIVDTIRDLSNRHGATVVYVSHDLPLVGQLARSTVVMYAGRIIEQGSTAEMFSRPRHPYTSGLLDAVPSGVGRARLMGIPGRPPRPGSWPAGCAFSDRCGSATQACTTELPGLIERDPGHRVRCIHPIAQRARASASESSGKRVAIGDARANAELGSSLVVERLEARYGTSVVLHDVSLEARPGRCTAIVGESGSGKTTLAQCLVGLRSQWSGSLTLDGAPLSRLSRERTDGQRRALQYIFQNPFSALNPRQTVAENIDEALRHFERRLPEAERMARISTILEAVALPPDFGDRMPGRLSGGERQRVAIGRALVLDPTVLVCDEVTSALDVSVQALIVEQLRVLQRDRGLTMLFITHNLALARELAQDIVVLQHGRVVESGTVADVLSNPRHDYTIRLLRDVPGMPVRVLD